MTVLSLTLRVAMCRALDRDTVRARGYAGEGLLSLSGEAMNTLLVLLLAFSLSACAGSSLDTRSSDHDNNLPNRQNVPQAGFNLGPAQPGELGIQGCDG